MKSTEKKWKICSRGHKYRGKGVCPLCWPGFRTYRVRAEVWLYSGEKASWHFVTLPKKESGEIKMRFGNSKRGWGAVKVEVTVGKTTWNTSIFPDKKLGAYVLPLKAEVRTQENIQSGDSIVLVLKVQE